MQLAGLHGGGSRRAIARPSPASTPQSRPACPPRSRAPSSPVCSASSPCSSCARASSPSAVVGGRPRARRRRSSYTGRLAGLEVARPAGRPSRDATAPDRQGGRRRDEGRTRRPRAAPAPPDQLRGALPGRARACGSTSPSRSRAATSTRSSPGPRPSASPTSTCAPARRAWASTPRTTSTACCPPPTPTASGSTRGTSRTSTTGRTTSTGRVAAITYTTPDGHRVDGFSADIETRAQGVNVAPDTARAYGAGLRRAVGPRLPAHRHRPAAVAAAHHLPVHRGRRVLRRHRADDLLAQPRGGRGRGRRR